MTIFTTSVSGLYTLPQVEGYTDVVVNVIYLITGVDGEYTANKEMRQSVAIKEGEAFTPYSQLTEAQILNWVNQEALSIAQAHVQAVIDNMINPPVSPTSQALPWSA